MARAGEIARVLELVEEDAAAPLAVVGSRGAGLSTFLAEVAAQSALPATVLGVSRAEADWPLSGLSAVLAAIDAAQGSELAMDRTLLDPELEDFPRAQALAERVREAVTHPMLLVIDDADDYDEDSRKALGFLLRRLAGSPLRVLLGVRPLPPGDAFEGLQMMHLAPVPVPDLIALGRAVHGIEADPAVLDFLARISGGSPLAFLSYVDELAPAVRHGLEPLPVPLNPGPMLTGVVTEILRDLGPQAEKALRALGASFYLPVAVAAALPEVTVEGIQELEGRWIITRTGEAYEVADPAAALVVYWSTPTEQRVRVHEALRRASEGVDEGLHAWHASHLAPSPAQAAPMLAAGRELIARGDRTLGIRMVERSLSLAPRAQLARELEALVREFVLAAEVDHARRYLRMLLGVGEGHGPSPVTAALRILLDGLQSQRTDGSVLAEALAAFSDTDPQGCRTLLLIVTAVRLYRFEIAPAERMVVLARELGGDDPQVEGAESMVALVRAALERKELPDLRELRTIADGSVGLLERAVGNVILARALAAADRYDEAVRLLDHVLETASAVPPLVLSLALDSLYTVELRAGRVGRARRAAERAGTSESLCGPFPLNQLLRLAELAIFDGDRTTARGHLHALFQRTGPGTSTLTRTRATLQQGRLALAEGDAASAIRFLRRGAQLGGVHRNPSLHRYHDVLIEALHLEGRAEEAQEVLEELAGLAEEFPSRWATRALARSRALLREDSGVLADYAELLDSWPTSQDEILRMRTMLAHAEALSRHGQAHRALEERRAAGEHLAGMGRRRTLVPTTEPPAAEDPAPRFEDLDDKERPVVERVLRGATNQAIARELFLSVRTVEMRLTGVYRRFDVSSRGELIALLRPEGEQGGRGVAGGGAAAARR